MTETDFLEAMETVDVALGAEGVPIPGRFLTAFQRMAPNYQGAVLGAGVNPDAHPPYEGPRLLRDISDWYQRRYGVVTN